MANIYERLLCRGGGEPRRVAGGPRHGGGTGGDRTGPQHGRRVPEACGATATPPSPSRVGETWLCSPGLQHPDLCCQQQTFKTSIGVTDPGGDDAPVTGSVARDGEMGVLLRKKKTAFLAERGGLGGRGSPAPHQVQPQVLRSHRLRLRDNAFAVKWSESSILSSQILL